MVDFDGPEKELAQSEIYSWNKSQKTIFRLLTLRTVPPLKSPLSKIREPQNAICYFVTLTPENRTIEND